MTHTLTFNQKEVEVLRYALAKLRDAIKDNINKDTDDDYADDDYKAGCIDDIGMVDNMLLAIPQNH